MNKARFWWEQAQRDLRHSLIYLANETRTPKNFFTFLRELTPEFVIVNQAVKEGVVIT